MYTSKHCISNQYYLTKLCIKLLYLSLFFRENRFLTGKLEKKNIQSHNGIYHLLKWINESYYYFAAKPVTTNQQFIVLCTYVHIKKLIRNYNSMIRYMHVCMYVCMYVCAK